MANEKKNVYSYDLHNDREGQGEENSSVLYLSALRAAACDPCAPALLPLARVFRWMMVQHDTLPICPSSMHGAQSSTPSCSLGDSRGIMLTSCDVRYCHLERRIISRKGAHPQRAPVPAHRSDPTRRPGRGRLAHT